jgi:glucose/arabinose dehydrogenase
MRRTLTALAATAVALAGLTAPADAATDPRQVKVTLTRQWSGLDQPVAIAHPSGDTRVFVVERTGRVRVIRDGVLRSTPFLDLHTKVNTAGEGGLLGLAFHPDYRSNGRLFVSWTDSAMTLHVTRYDSTPGRDTAKTPGVDIIKVAHPGASNHNAGQLAFGPGKYLFIGTGDGGGGGDPDGNAQDPNALLGKILRIDVTNKPAGQGYDIPSTNPFVNGGGKKEIWALGLRNPWKFSFDRGSPGELYVGDVGQGDREEVDIVDRPDRNLGWDCREGTLNTASQYGGTYCKSTGYQAPVTEYGHDLGCAIIGGYVYRGSRYKTLLDGTYLYADYCSGRVWGLGRDANGGRVTSQLGAFSGHVVGFGQVAYGELYLIAENGGIYRISASHR